MARLPATTEPFCINFGSLLLFHLVRDHCCNLPYRLCIFKCAIFTNLCGNRFDKDSHIALRKITTLWYLFSWSGMQFSGEAFR